MQYTLSANNLHIYNSYKVRKCKMRSELRGVERAATPGETFVFERSIFSLKMEWICHNFLYNVGYERDRTKDADLDNPCDRPEWQYIVCGLLVWIFVW